MNPKIVQLRSLKAECLACKSCPLYRGDGRVASPHVFGRGNVKAKLMVVGQNPGYYETVEKKPFIGKAGKNFDAFLSEVLGLERKYIYITNTVKCYTPNNRGPTDEEVQTCKRFLKQELEIIKPRIILALGNYALQYFTGHGGMTRCHGKIEHSKEFDVDVFPMYHPSPLNMNKAEIRELTRKDFETLKQILEKEES